MKNFIIALMIFLVFDGLWLGIFMKSFYSNAFGSLARRTGNSLSPNWLATGFAYFLLVLGISILVLNQAQGSVGKALLLGAIFGLVVYGVYDFTNMATLNGWSWKLVMVDVIWGIFLCSVVGAGSVLIGNLIK